MAKKKATGEFNQSDAIKEGWQSLGRHAKGRDVIAYVDEHYPSFRLGQKPGASPMVSQMKSKLFGRRRKKPKKQPTKAPRAARRTPRAGRNQDVRLLLEARAFVSKCGSVDRAVTVLKQLRELQVTS